ncbi:penicillin-binding protein 2 [Desulfuromonas sp. AOP6]|uniref:penicillin-binding protein 2 n=1 Tax=Desulfuromonas sp. AOP6 TaxID=1566351 RepID=UPI0012766E84|nr:penicillin-binding protein 2 [Desulfuromonas sp. AOP6]BCA80293.1 penicillin-binding protein 2 [Desulfuromonas sp. AOP6]
MGLNAGWSETPGLKTRFVVVSVAAAVVFLLLLMRLWYLQVINADVYLRLSEKNRLRYIPVEAPRGSIYDRDGLLLVDNRPAFGVSVLRQDVEDSDLLLETLAGYLDEDAVTLHERYQKGKRLPAYRPLPLAEDIGRDRMEVIQENASDLPGLLTGVRPVRSYPYQESGAHLFGYLGEITEQQLQSQDFSGYRSGEFVGKSGVEKRLENTLRGHEGQQRLEVDVRGKLLRSLQTRDPFPGNRVYLTIKRDLQLAAEVAFEDHAGAAVMLDVHSGEVLALVSRPSFNPEAFAQGISSEEWISLLKDSRHPLQNKALTGQYPPGSTFKIVSALAALKSGLITASTSVECTGKLEVGDREFRCWKRTGHGKTNLKKALKESCDVWFYQVAQDLGIDRLSETASDLGLGSPLGIDLEGEKSGLIPTRDWKRRRFGAPWYDGETVIASIGQGYVLTTPLQLAVMTATVANGGTVYRPQVVKKIVDLVGNVLVEHSPEIIKSTPFSPRDLSAVHTGLVAAVNEPGGTAWSRKLDGLKVAGKTGTAQVVRLKDDDDKEEDEDKIPYRFRDHALFVAYAPADAPEVAVAVVVEHGRHGSSVAAPIAMKMMANYFGVDVGALPDHVPYAGD